MRSTPPAPLSPTARRILLAAVAGLFAVLGAFAANFAHSTDDSPGAPVESENQRIISLSPAITETLRHFEEQERLVGVSDYCQTSSDEVPRVGTALTPNYEKIARLEPDLILTTHVGGQQLTPLAGLAPTHLLPWLTLEDILGSLKTLGTLVHRERASDNLRKQLRAALDVQASPSAPRVLFAFESSAESGQQTWYIKRNSVHGAVLRAAGGRNAVERDVMGQPQLQPEEILKINPDVILILRPLPPDPEAEKQIVERFAQLTPLTAVRENRVAVLSRPDGLSLGPQLLELVPSVTAALERLTRRANQEARTVKEESALR